ncbi:hypothetical protein BDN72DRAFT_898823 [Pluteus cervinus]|uniref:Uncharacterized protein n=1 Tax=Pluteus cervinus TaxID=181527 RepID=A0ACD3AQL2_9AGAR|nr:hypothetical protein BDN72DRAFT_898823 [Pluteus cervinus]
MPRKSKAHRASVGNLTKSSKKVTIEEIKDEDAPGRTTFLAYSPYDTDDADDCDDDKDSDVNDNNNNDDDNNNEMGDLTSLSQPWTPLQQIWYAPSN